MSFHIPRGSIDPKSVWDSNTLVALDTETTGKEPDSRVVEIAVVKAYPDGTREEWSTLVKPGVTIPKGASKIHGITAKMVKDAPKFADVYDEVVERLRGCIPVAFNFTYDWQIFRNEAKRIGKPWFVFFGICPLMLSRGLIKAVPGGYKQTNITEYLGIHDDEASDHRALDDTRHTVRVLTEALGPKMAGWSTQQLWDFQVRTARIFENKLTIRKNGKSMFKEWHEFTKEEG